MGQSLLQQPCVAVMRVNVAAPLCTVMGSEHERLPFAENLGPHSGPATDRASQVASRQAASPEVVLLWFSRVRPDVLQNGEHVCLSAVKLLRCSAASSPKM